MAKIKFDTHFNFTTVDPPELLRFIRDNYPDVIWDRPEKTMWQLIEEKLYPPTRIARYCCQYLKERGGRGRFVILGIRSAESYKRKYRPMFENCTKENRKLLSPIIDWSDSDVWDFIKQKKLKYCCLYDEGYKRIGCVLCPMQTLRMKKVDIKRYPGFYKAYLKAFGKMLKRHKERGIKSKQWHTAEDVIRWWIYEKSKIKQDTLF